MIKVLYIHTSFFCGVVFATQVNIFVARVSENLECCTTLILLRKEEILEHAKN